MMMMQGIEEKEKKYIGKCLVGERKGEMKSQGSSARRKEGG